MHEPVRPDDRGISEILGTVLLISLVLVGSAVVIVLGAGAIGDAQEQTRTQSAEDHLEELDARLSTLSSADDRPHAEFEPNEALARDYTIRRDGYVKVTVDGNATCSFQQELSTITYEDSQGRTVGYEAGGVWRGSFEGSSAVTAPDVTFENGILDVNLVNLTGQIDRATNVAELNVTATRLRTENLSEKVQQGTCVRPDNLTLWVNSEFQNGWRNYLAAETGVPESNVTTFSNGTVKVFVNQSFLHPSVDDSRNKVVNLSGAPYMPSVKLNGFPAPPTVGVDKGANNTYSVFVEPLSDDELGIGRPITVEGQDLTGPPLDVSLVLDESGSMSGSKIAGAKNAAQNFVGVLNESRDRLSLQTYNDSGFHRPIDGLHFSRDFDAVNDTIQNDFFAGGTTRIDRGLNNSLSVHDLKSNENREKFTVLLTDGINNNCGWVLSDPYTCRDNELTLETAWRADNNSVTVFTVGFGSNVEEELLRDVANATGGTYYQADNSSELNEAFQDIGRSITATNAIAATPMTSNISTGGGQLYDADVPGDTDHIANVSTGTTDLLNINDPTATALFSHSFALSDGEDAEFNVTKYDCEPDAWNLTGRTRTINGTSFSMARCTDIGAVNGSFDADIYVDGERPDTLLQTTYAPWQEDVNASLNAFPSLNINSTTGELEAKSNQALVVYDLPPEGPGTRNTLTLVLQIGEAETDGQGIVNVRVSEATLSNS